MLLAGMQGYGYDHFDIPIMGHIGEHLSIELSEFTAYLLLSFVLELVNQSLHFAALVKVIERCARVQRHPSPEPLGEGIFLTEVVVRLGKLQLAVQA